MLLALALPIGLCGVGCSSNDDAAAGSRLEGDGGPKVDADGRPGVGQTCLDPENQRACKDGLTCVMRTSTPNFGSCDSPIVVPAGGCCQQHVDCFAGEVCTETGCAPNKNGRCSPDRLLSSATCARGYICQAGSAGQMDHCVEAPNPRPLGAACDGPSQCGKDGVCEGVCTTVAGENEPCSVSYDNACLDGLHCDTMMVDGSFVSTCQRRTCVGHSKE